MPQSDHIRNSNPRTSRKYGFACSNCRRRKARCNGAMPACQKCLASNESCSYDKAPSVAYAVSLQNQLQAYKDRIEELRQVKDEDRDALLNEPICTVSPNEGRSRAFKGNSDVHIPLRIDTTTKQGTADAAEMTSVGTDGRVCFYGKTSLYHIDPHNFEPDSPETNHDTSIEENSHDMTYMPSVYPDFCDTASILAETPSALLTDLLNTYWTYPHHLHCVLCKPLFLRDLYSSGPYVTPFLLCAVLTQAARYSTRLDAVEIGQGFAAKALQLLPRDIEKGSSIPTIQGLLVFSARECACGRVSQGWLYSGMAFRMMRDLGIDVSPKKLGHLAKQFSEEDLAIRQQVFWSCYTWDKTMSVCLGRPAVLHCSVELPTSDTLPFGREADDEIWPPTLTNGSLADGLVKQKALSSARFVAYCELSIITESILDTLYSRPHSGQQDHLLTYLDTTLQRLHSWADRLRPELFVKETATTIVSPPLHILLLNLTYHAATILLCRPYRTVQQNAKERCTKASKMVDTLFILHVKRFGFRYVTYLQTYTLFVACTINVLDFTESDGPSGDSTLAREANARLHFGLEIFRQANSTPAAARCAATISQLFQRQKTSKQNEKTNPTASARLDSPTTDVVASSSTREPAISSLPTLPTPYQPHVTIPEPVPTIDGPRIQDRNMAEPFDFSLPIETPLRWLPENVQDDGSWMLMTDVNFNGDFDFSSMAEFS
ncbi:fungal-specific transcription factor domain-containing protein [Annulohypoxylon maeteangense]|uniref:fungal-specific transcription factor domain-containing protein n=1 Tax=Annulohypoxylon maeteangense TaxID=1927788 RepID=UPI002008D9AC|nr:fungal-specific transcription factor domain-containing protein [Annulohypoxylon maeteangense]KAI0883746.1 fungal-specific transcription factor domain-containing protein [Annulohypoxylon maeteangense]